MTFAIWDDTFHSQLCVAIWVPRGAMADSPEAVRAALNAQWEIAREAFLTRAAEWIQTPEYDRILVGGNIDDNSRA